MPDLDLLKKRIERNELLKEAMYLLHIIKPNIGGYSWEDKWLSELKKLEDKYNA